MTNIIKTGNIATAHHHMNANHKAASAFKGQERRSGENDTFSVPGQASCSQARNFITSYHDILVVNIKCL